MDFNFQSISHLCFSKSKVFKAQENNTLYFIMILALSSIFTNGILLYIITLMAALLEIRVIYFKIKHDEFKLLGHKSNSFNFISYSYNSDLANDKAYILTNFTKNEIDKLQAHHVNNYFKTQAIDNRNKLLEALQESCFYTIALYRKLISSQIVTLIFYISALLLLIFLSSFFSNDSNFDISRLILLVFVAFPIKDVIQSLINLTSASASLKSIEEQSINVNDEASVLSYFSQYNICVALAPLIPDKIFNKESSKLEQIWKLKINQQGITNV
jgi:hypothetical protein